LSWKVDVPKPLVHGAADAMVSKQRCERLMTAFEVGTSAYHSHVINRIFLSLVDWVKWHPMTWRATPVRPWVEGPELFEHAGGHGVPAGADFKAALKDFILRV
jgi:hypothetical protein